MNENNAAQAAQKDWDAAVSAANLAPATGHVVLNAATVLNIAALLSKLRAPVADGWQSIKTAPQGVRVLLGPRHAPVIGIVKHYEDADSDEPTIVCNVVHYNGTVLVAGYRTGEWAPLASAPVAGETQQCVACEGRPSGDNIPCALCGRDAAPQASAEDVRLRELLVRCQAWMLSSEHDRPNMLIALIQDALQSQPQADKDGGQQRAGDGKTREAVDYPRGDALNFDGPVAVGPSRKAILAVMRPHLDEADGGYAADTAPDKIVAAGRAVLALAALAALSAPQAEQGERDE